MLTPDFRGEILPLLPPGAFLRRDRGAALYVSNAPARLENADALAAALRKMGFHTVLDGALMRLVPRRERLLALENALPPPDALALSMERWRGMAATAENLALFCMGVKCLESGLETEIFHRRLRQSAAAALRLGGGGGLYACAMVCFDLKQQWRI